MDARALTDEQRERLRLLVQRRSTPHRVRVRARAILLLGELPSIAAVARELDVSDDSVNRWARRWADRGIDGLADAPRSGRPPTYGADVRLRIVEAATRVRPDAGHASSHPSAAEIAAELDRDGIAISASQVGRILAACQLKPHRVRSWLQPT